MKEKIDWRIVVAGMVCIVWLVSLALILGYNGIILITTLSGLFLTIGIALPQWIKR